MHEQKVTHELSY